MAIQEDKCNDFQVNNSDSKTEDNPIGQIDAESANECLISTPASLYEAPVSYLPVKPVTTLFNGTTATQTMFGTIKDDRITFLIDTSGSMYGCLQAVKSHLVSAILELSQRTQTYVNIVKFDADVVKWTDKMVRCTSTCYDQAAKWIQENIEVNQGHDSNTLLQALRVSFSDVNSNALYLISDGLIYNNTEHILNQVSYDSNRRPLHCFHVTSDPNKEDVYATRFFKDLALITNGSYHHVAMHENYVHRSHDKTAADISHNDCIYPDDQLYKRCSAYETIDAPLAHFNKPVQVATPLRFVATPPRVVATPFGGVIPASNASISANLATLNNPYLPLTPRLIHHPLCYPPYTWIADYDYYTYDTSSEPDLNVAASLLVGKTVLARWTRDGFFYQGTVNREIDPELFIVEFPSTTVDKQGFSSSEFQKTNVQDLISLTDALRRKVSSGDRVLVPLDGSKVKNTLNNHSVKLAARKYAPGIVIKGHEKRNEIGSPDVPLVISVTVNDRTDTLTPELNTAIWIPNEVYERLCIEVQLTKDQREDFQTLANDLDSGYPRQRTCELTSEISPSYYLPSRPLHPVMYESYYPPREMLYIPHPPSSRILPRPLSKPIVAVNIESPDISIRRLNGDSISAEQLDLKVKAQLEQYEHQTNTNNLSSVEKKVMFTKNLIDPSSDDGEHNQTSARNISDEAVETLSPDFNDLEIDDLLSDYVYDPTLDIDINDSPLSSRSTLKSTIRPVKSTRPITATCRPPWKYWKGNSTPSLRESNHYGAYRVGAYDTRQSTLPLQIENTSTVLDKPLSQYVCYNYKTGEDNKQDHYRPNVYKPTPPPTTPEKNKEEKRRDFRRQHILERRCGLLNKRNELEKVEQRMVDNHREAIVKQIKRDQQRQIDANIELQQRQMAKCAINDEFRSKIESNRNREYEKQQTRQMALQRGKQRRMDLANDRNLQIELKFQQKNNNRSYFDEERRNNHFKNCQLKEEQAHKNERSRNIANCQIIEHFHQLEDIGQKQRDFINKVNIQNKQRNNILI